MTKTQNAALASVVRNVTPATSAPQKKLSLKEEYALLKEENERLKSNQKPQKAAKVFEATVTEKGNLFIKGCEGPMSGGLLLRAECFLNCAENRKAVAQVIVDNISKLTVSGKTDEEQLRARVSVAERARKIV